MDADADPGPDPSLQIKAQNLEKLQIDADADPDPAYHVDADMDQNRNFQVDVDPHTQHYYRHSGVEYTVRNHSIPGCRVAGDQVGKMVMHSQSRGRQVIRHTQQQVLT
jgi:hypothetical protein